MKTSGLTGAALDWAVAKCEGHNMDYFQVVDAYLPSTDWAQGGPIIEREKIEIHKGNDLYFPSGNEKGDYYEPLWIAGKQHGQTPLIAAMRCYVESKLGDDVTLPPELEQIA
jgi:hypothetical protein